MMFTILALLLLTFDDFTVEVIRPVQRFTVVVQKSPAVPVVTPVIPAKKPDAGIPASEKTVTRVRQQYLVSEVWCGPCVAAKKRFLSLGWPQANILTLDECQRRFGFRPSRIPFEFTEPAKSEVAKPVSSARPMTHGEMVRLHNQLHGGAMHTWPGDLATHLETTHGQKTSVPLSPSR